jgi:hypothetical protein
VLIVDTGVRKNSARKPSGPHVPESVDELENGA